MNNDLKNAFIGVMLFIFAVLFTVVVLELTPYEPEGNQEAVPVVTPVPTPPNQPIYLVVKCPNQTITYRVTDDLRLNRL